MYQSTQEEYNELCDFQDRCERNPDYQKQVEEENARERIERENRIAQAQKRQAKNEKAKRARIARKEIMESLGLTRGKDSMGRTIWE